MPTVGDTKLVGSTWNNRIVFGEIYIKASSTIADKVEVVMSLRILHDLIRGMQIDVLQSECIHSRKDLKASLLCKKAL